MVCSAAPARLGGRAPHVVAAAGSGDAVALELIETAAGHLTGTAVAAAGDERPAVIVIGGSVLIHARPIAERVRASLSERWPGVPIIRSANGEAGAVVLATRQGGRRVTPSTLKRLRAGSAESA